MHNKLIISLLTLTLYASALYGQDRIDYIRKEYYRINGKDNLNNIELSGYKFFIEDNRVVKATIKDSTGFSEYYYEFDNRPGTYNLLFAYFNPNKSASNLPDARYYFNEREGIMRYKENNESASFFEADKYLKSVPLKAKNAINIFLNTFINATDQYAEQKFKIDSLFLKIENSTLTKTNSPEEIYEEEGQYYNGGEKVFVNNEGKIVKKYHAEGNHHGSDTEIKYYHEGHLILEIIEKAYYINGFQYSVYKNYYARPFFEQILFRKEIYKNYESSLESTYKEDKLLKFHLDNIVPEIKIERKR
jgi:hypothetical protein